MRVIFVVRDLKMQHVGIMMLSAILSAGGTSVEVAPADVAEVVRRVRAKPGERTILAYSTPTVYYLFYWRINRDIRRILGGNEVISIFGGPHATFSPEMVENEAIDVICVGEGDEAFPEFVRAYESGQDYRHIQNLWVKQDGQIFRNPLRPLIQDLDSLPFADRTIFGKETIYYQHRAAILTSRGCPFDCRYCFNHAYKALYGPQARKFRQRSVDNVLKEMHLIKQNKAVRFIVLQDDNFIVDPDWIDEFSARYAKEIGIPFYAKVHPNFVTERTAGALGRARCVAVGMGLETADEKLRKEVFGRPVNTRQIIRACELLHQNGISIETYNIIGIPTGSLEADLRTLDLNVVCKVDHAECTMLSPYPGTRIHEFAKERGLLPDDYAGYADPDAPTVNLVSHIKFASKKDKQRVENLHKLFGYGVMFPRLRPVIRRLIDLPPNRFFNDALLVYRAYCTYFRSMPVGFKGLVQRILAGRWSFKHYA